MPKRCASPMGTRLTAMVTSARVAGALDEGAVVHLVDVIAGQDEHQVARRLADGLDVLEHGVGRAAIPLAGAAAGDVRLQHPDAAALRSRSQGRPTPMWSLSERGLYCVRTTTLSMLELTQLLSVKSMIRYLPAKGTAGLARMLERIDRRSPSPPARTTARTRFTRRCYRAAAASSPVAHHGSRSEEQARVDEVVLELDRPVEVGAGRVAGVALPADDVAAVDVRPLEDARRLPAPAGGRTRSRGRPSGR